MLLSAALIALLLAGCWLYCLADAVFTPAAEFPGPRKGVWIGLILLTFVVGGVIWLAARRSALSRPEKLRQPEKTSSPRHPARRGRADNPVWQPGWSGPATSGPDDDPEFLELLSRRIRGTSESGE